MEDKTKEVDTLANALGIPAAPPKREVANPEPPADNQIPNDAEYVRTNLYDMINKGSEAVYEAAEIARQSQHPRAFEVLGGLLGQVGGLTDKLMKLHKEKKELLAAENGPTSPNGNVNIENAVFVGSSDQLIRMIKDAKKKNNESVDNNVIDLTPNDFTNKEE
jgi:hypothetical protein